LFDKTIIQIQLHTNNWTH